MAVVTPVHSPPIPATIPALENGDSLTRAPSSSAAMRRCPSSRRPNSSKERFTWVLPYDTGGTVNHTVN